MCRIREDKISNGIVFNNIDINTDSNNKSYTDSNNKSYTNCNIDSNVCSNILSNNNKSYTNCHITTYSFKKNKFSKRKNFKKIKK